MLFYYADVAHRVAVELVVVIGVAAADLDRGDVRDRPALVHADLEAAPRRGQAAPDRLT